MSSSIVSPSGPGRQALTPLRVGWLVTPLSPRGGTFTHLKHWADGLAGSNIHPTLLYFSPEEAAGQAFPWPAHTPRIRLDALNLSGTPSPTVVREVLRVLKDQKLDLLHTIFIGADLLGLMLKPLLGLPLLSSVEGELLVSHLSRSRRLVLESAYRLLSGGLEQVTAVSRATALGVSQYLGGTGPDGINPRVQVLHPGVLLPSEALLAQAVPKDPTRPHVVTIGRLVPVKGLPLLVEALERLKPRVPGLRVSIVGDGPEREPLQALVRSRNLDDIVQFRGWLPPEGVAEVLDSAHLLVQPSYSEGLPWTCLEAMARGVPVVAARVGGLPELMEPSDGPDAVGDSSVGYCVPPNRSDKLLMALAEALEGPDALTRLAVVGARARRRVAQHFSAQQELEGLRSLYSRLVRRA